MSFLEDVINVVGTVVFPQSKLIELVNDQIQNGNTDPDTIKTALLEQHADSVDEQMLSVVIKQVIN